MSTKVREAHFKNQASLVLILGFRRFFANSKAKKLNLMAVKTTSARCGSIVLHSSLALHIHLSNLAQKVTLTERHLDKCFWFQSELTKKTCVYCPEGRMFPSAKDLADHKIEEHKVAHFRSENTNSILSAKEFLKLPENIHEPWLFLSFKTKWINKTNNE